MSYSPFSSTRSTPTARGGVYRQVGLETQLSGAAPHTLVAMLFEGALVAVHEAVHALRTGDVAAKGVAVGRAVRIVEEGLRGGLDLQAPGGLAAQLHALYGYISLRLTEANLFNDEAALQECLQLLAPLQQGWAGIAPQGGDPSQTALSNTRPLNPALAA
jgi:flagellar secretion chaperone FliS